MYKTVFFFYLKGRKRVRNPALLDVTLSYNLGITSAESQVFKAKEGRAKEGQRDLS